MSVVASLSAKLLDGALLESDLASAKPTLQVFKKALQTANQTLKQEFEVGAPVKDLVRQRAHAVDMLVVKSWVLHGLPEIGMALAAVGGYGRGELHPASDIDIAILIGSAIDDEAKRRIEGFITFLWDVGLQVGHSVRSIRQCKKQAKADITVATNLMEARLLYGDRKLYQRMRRVTGPEQIWPTRVFFEAKLQEQITRHRKFDDAVQDLEPHVKEGPGGLRDIQTVGWVAKRHFGVETLGELIHQGFLTEEEYQTLDTGQSYLWRTRMALHLLTGRCEDRLLFDYQRDVARVFGYVSDDNQQLGVERFMKMYYRTVMELSRLNEMLLELFQEAILSQRKREKVRPLNKRFQIRNNYIEVCNNRVFRRYPFALLEIFLLLQRNPQIEGVRASTIRLIRQHCYLIDENFRNDIRARSLFMEIIRQPRRLGHELQRMHRYGVLAAYLPVFEAVTGLMQFDLFHVYTVDEHTLIVVRNMRRYTVAGTEDDLPMCRRIMSQLPKPELLYLAGFFHDIGKGRGGDHSDLGAQEAASFCKHHGLSQYDTNLVAWLVRNHLSMSTTAQRQDISDPDVITEFARRVGEKTRLDYLYLLTVADIRGTSPSLWNSWKDALLTELYDNTLRALRRGVSNPIEKQERIAEVQGEVLALLCHSNVGKDAVLSLWESVGEDYFLRYWPDEIGWQTKSILSSKEEELPLILVRQETRRGGTEIFIYTRDEAHIFAATTQALDQAGLTIMDARIISTANGYTLDTYIVLDAATNQTVADRDRIDSIIATLKRYLARKGIVAGRVNRSAPRQLKHFRQETHISFSEDAVNNRTIMEVIAIDRPGFLSLIGTAMQFCGVQLQNAKVATFGERVEDIFYITDRDNQPITDPVKIECLRNSIIDTLGAETRV